METLFLKVVNQFPELINLTSRISNIHAFGERIYKNDNFICSLVWIIKYYFYKEVYLFVPKQFSNSLEIFNNFIENKDFFLDESILLNSEINSFDKKIKNSVIVYSFADFIFNEHNNKKRLNTQIKTFIKRNNINIILSCTCLKALNVNILSSFRVYRFKEQCLLLNSFNKTCIDIYDDDDLE